MSEEYITTETSSSSSSEAATMSEDSSSSGESRVSQIRGMASEVVTKLKSDPNPVFKFLEEKTGVCRVKLIYGKFLTNE